jgi:hypothetical protein
VLLGKLKHQVADKGRVLRYSESPLARATHMWDGRVSLLTLGRRSRLNLLHGLLNILLSLGDVLLEQSKRPHQ